MISYLEIYDALPGIRVETLDMCMPPAFLLFVRRQFFIHSPFTTLHRVATGGKIGMRRAGWRRDVTINI
jgi:hypothetical protein